jgi:hypothetical protein
MSCWNFIPSGLYMLSLIDWLIACANSSDDHGVHQWSPNGGPEGSNRLASHVRPGCGAPPLHWGRPPSQRLWHSNSEPANGRKLFSGNHPYHLSSSFFFHENIVTPHIYMHVCISVRLMQHWCLLQNFLHAQKQPSSYICFLLFMINAGVEADLKRCQSKSSWYRSLVLYSLSSDQMHGASVRSSSTIITGCSLACISCIDQSRSKLANLARTKQVIKIVQVYAGCTISKCDVLIYAI